MEWKQCEMISGCNQKPNTLQIAGFGQITAKQSASTCAMQIHVRHREIKKLNYITLIRLTGNYLKQFFGRGGEVTVRDSTFQAMETQSEKFPLWKL